MPEKRQQMADNDDYEDMSIEEMEATHAEPVVNQGNRPPGDPHHSGNDDPSGFEP